MAAARYKLTALEGRTCAKSLSDVRWIVEKVSRV
jgi:hypothetical protein